MKPSGIGGQAVIEGIMMRNKDKYSIAVRKPDHEIEVTVRDCKLLTEKHKWMGYPIIRGVVSFIDSLITGISTINYSASFYDDPEEQKITKADEIGKSLFKDMLLCHSQDAVLRVIFMSQKLVRVVLPLARPHLHIYLHSYPWQAFLPLCLPRL